MRELIDAAEVLKVRGIAIPFECDENDTNISESLIIEENQSCDDSIVSSAVKKRKLNGEISPEHDDNDRCETNNCQEVSATIIENSFSSESISSDIHIKKEISSKEVNNYYS